MKFDRSLQVGAKEGHWPVRSFVKLYKPGKSIFFDFTAPRRFNSYHGFELGNNNSAATILKHVLEMKAVGTALFT